MLFVKILIIGNHGINHTEPHQKDNRDMTLFSQKDKSRYYLFGKKNPKTNIFSKRKKAVLGFA